METTAPRIATRPNTLKNVAFHLVGAGMLALNKVRHEVQGYRTPRPFPVTDIEQALEHDFGVVDRWRTALSAYIGTKAPFEGRHVVELGPGADLGCGVLLLAEGAESYTALDVHRLAPNAPDVLYDELFRRLEGAYGSVGWAREAYRAWRSGAPVRLEYLIDDRFDVQVLAGRGTDLVVSNAAFEHFDDVARVTRDLAEVVEPGAHLVSEVDLQTHSRWIRERDPLNIYRYSDAFYGAFKFRGSPNRWRPHEYVDALERAGWGDVRVHPLTVLRQQDVDAARPALNRRFRDTSARMEILSFMLFATRSSN
jgi:SAM-dependent methyltransferase